MVKFLKHAYVWLVYLFLYAPILVLILFSFNASSSQSKFTGFSLKWYGELFQNSEVLHALQNTLTIALLSALISTVVGTVSAIGISEMKKGKWFIMNVTYLPVLNPDIVTGISLMVLFVFAHIPLGYGTLLIAHTVFNIPYVIISVLPKLQQLDKNTYEAALDLGSTPFHAYTRVILPEIMPGVITGLLLAFTLSIDDFIISFFTTGPGVNNLSILIYSYAKKGIKPYINALSAIMFLVILILLFIVNKRSAFFGAKVEKD